jgi:hypothetical protein
MPLRPLLDGYSGGWRHGTARAAHVCHQRRVSLASMCNPARVSAASGRAGLGDARKNLRGKLTIFALILFDP